MNTTVFSTIDHFTSHFKPIDSLINSIASRLLPQQEARGYTCPSGQYVCNVDCNSDAMCNPEYKYNEFYCCWNGSPEIANIFIGDCVCYDA